MKELASVRNVVKLGLVSLIWVCVLSLSCSAVEFGLGIAITNNDQGIYVPVNFTDRFRTEFSATYESADDTNEVTATELRTIEAGIGLFLLKEIHEKTQLYYGCRFLYIDTDQRHRVRDFDYHYQKMDGNGYAVVPTLGVEYFLGRHISLGGEIEYSYGKMDIDYESNIVDVDDHDGEQTASGLDGRVVLRFYF